MNKLKSLLHNLLKKSVSKKSQSRIRIPSGLIKHIPIFILSALCAYAAVGLVTGRISLPSVTGGDNAPMRFFDSARSAFSHMKLPGTTGSKQNEWQGYADAWTVISDIGSGNFRYTIIDMRSKDDYTKVHLQETVNIPYPYLIDADADTHAFVSAVQKIQNSNTLILLPYSMFSQTGIHAQRALKKEGIQSFVLSAGWNELYNLPNIWVPESSWESFSIIDIIDGVQE